MSRRTYDKTAMQLLANGFCQLEINTHNEKNKSHWLGLYPSNILNMMAETRALLCINSNEPRPGVWGSSQEKSEGRGSGFISKVSSAYFCKEN